MSTQSRTSLAIAVLTCSALMAGCGVDPPAAPAASSPAGETAAPAEPAGTPLVERTDLEAPKANGDLARCNIETLAEQSLEGTHPALKAGRAVVVRGWYAVPTSAKAPSDSQEAPADSGDSAVAVAPTAEAAGAAGPMLVIASENGARHWTVALPEMRLRRDVAEALGDASLGNSGFDLAIDLSALAPGFYGVHLSDAAHTAASVCGMGRGFVIQ